MVKMKGVEVMRQGGDDWYNSIPSNEGQRSKKPPPHQYLLKEVTLLAGVGEGRVDSSNSIPSKEAEVSFQPVRIPSLSCKGKT